MSPSLVGLHDREAVAISPSDTWILDTIALSENPASLNYPVTHHWICRVNWGYGSTGTIPLPDQDNQFIERLVRYVSESKNCRRWVIGNEPNLPREWPDGREIHPKRYADFYLRCRDAIKNLSGHENDEVLIAASGPWNDQYKYAGNPTGDWIEYFVDVISFCGSRTDGFSLHAYTHGYDKSLVISEAMMDAPFQNRHYNFRTYRDYCAAIPNALAHLPVYITEANGNGAWQAVGLMQMMAMEIEGWNKQVTDTKIKSLIFYRYPKYDAGAEYAIEGKPDVIADYLVTVTLGFQSPVVSTPERKIYMPQIVSGAPKAKVKAILLNVRDRPGVENTNIIGTLKLDDEISILEEINFNGDTWYRVGDNAWVSAMWIKHNELANSLSNWERSRSFTARWEGGIQDYDWDLGNWTGCEVGQGQKKGTNFGISACAYPGLDIRNISRQQADEIYYRDYWLRSGADQLEWPLCLLVFDTAINFHPTTARIWLEESKRNPLVFIALRLRGYRKSKAWPQAGNAWVDRVIDLLLEASDH